MKYKKQHELYILGPLRLLSARLGGRRPWRLAVQAVRAPRVCWVRGGGRAGPTGAGVARAVLGLFESPGGFHHWGAALCHVRGAQGSVGDRFCWEGARHSSSSPTLCAVGTPLCAEPLLAPPGLLSQPQSSPLMSAGLVHMKVTHLSRKDRLSGRAAVSPVGEGIL